MNPLHSSLAGRPGWIDGAVVDRLGWMLLHSLWQLAAIALIYGMVARLLTNRPRGRYVAGCLALCAGALMLPVTFSILATNSTAGTAQSKIAVGPRPADATARSGQRRPLLDASQRAAVEAPGDGIGPAENQSAIAAPRLLALSATWKRSLQPWLPALVAGWLAGVAVLAVRPACGWLAACRLKRCELTPVANSVQQMFRDVSQRLHIRSTVAVVQSGLVRSPSLVGWWRPLVLLPACAITGLAPSELEAVMAHELAHVRRHDYLVNVLQTLVETLLFYHPAAWWLSACVRRERENCCDDLAVAAGGDRANYVRALLNLEQLRAAPSSLALAANGGALLQRVRRIAGMADEDRSPARPWAAGGSILALATVLVLGLLAAADSAAKAPAANHAGQADAQAPSVALVPSAAAPRATPGDGIEPEPGLLVSRPADPPAQDDDPEPKQTAAEDAKPVELAVAFLKNWQRDDGSWPDPVGYTGGITSLCTLALLRSGLAADDAAVTEAIDYLRKLPPVRTYSAALATLALCEADPQKDRALIERNVKWLQDQQKKNGAMQGAWGYPEAEGDNSNTGFAVMALYGAERAGVHAERETWRRMLDYWIKTQNANGSWGYRPGQAGSGSMTCEGVFCVAAAAEILDERQADRPAQLALANAQQWLARQFSVTENPGTRGAQGWHYYFLFAAAEGGRMSNVKTFGKHDWYREGAELLMGVQEPEGSWQGKGHAEDNRLVATSLALLFLRHGAAQSD